MKKVRVVGLGKKGDKIIEKKIRKETKKKSKMLNNRKQRNKYEENISDEKKRQLNLRL